MNEEKVRIAIAEDHPVVRRGVRRIVERLPEAVVVGEAADGRRAMEIIQQAEPDVLILDIEMPLMNGIEVLKALRRFHIGVFVLVLSIIDDPFFIREVLALGACIYVIKGDIDQLVQALDQALRGECANRKMEETRGRVRIY